MIKVQTDHGHEWYFKDDDLVRTESGTVTATALDAGVTVFLPEWQNEWPKTGSTEEGYLLGALASDSPEDASTLRKLGINPAHVPESVIDGSPDMVRGYLASLFENFGRIHKGLLEPQLHLFHVHETFLWDVQDLLQRFGILGRMVRRSLERRVHRSVFEISISHAGMLIFEREISAIPVKQALDFYGRNPLHEEPVSTKVRRVIAC